jgi:hypothetical protein
MAVAPDGSFLLVCGSKLCWPESAGVVICRTSRAGGEYGAVAPMPLPGGPPAPRFAAVASAGT